MFGAKLQKIPETAKEIGDFFFTFLTHRDVLRREVGGKNKPVRGIAPQTTMRYSPKLQAHPFRGLVADS